MCISSESVLQGHQCPSCFQRSLVLDSSVWSHCCFPLVSSCDGLPRAPQVAWPVPGFPLLCPGAACIPLPGSRHLAVPREMEIACWRLPGNLEADNALGSWRAIIFQLLSCWHRLAMETQLLWDWGEALCLAGGFVFSQQPPLLALGSRL